MSPDDKKKKKNCQHKFNNYSMEVLVVNTLFQPVYFPAFFRCNMLLHKVLSIFLVNVGRIRKANSKSESDLGEIKKIFLN